MEIGLCFIRLRVGIGDELLSWRRWIFGFCWRRVACLRVLVKCWWHTVCLSGDYFRIRCIESVLAYGSVFVEDLSCILCNLWRGPYDITAITFIDVSRGNLTFVSALSLYSFPFSCICSYYRHFTIPPSLPLTLRQVIIQNMSDGMKNISLSTRFVTPAFPQTSAFSEDPNRRTLKLYILHAPVFRRKSGQSLGTVKQRNSFILKLSAPSILAVSYRI